jgi:hypothetical protein
VIPTAGPRCPITSNAAKSFTTSRRPRNSAPAAVSRVCASESRRPSNSTWNPPRSSSFAPSRRATRAGTAIPRPCRRSSASRPPGHSTSVRFPRACAVRACWPTRSPRSSPITCPCIDSLDNWLGRVWRSRPRRWATGCSVRPGC